MYEMKEEYLTGIPMIDEEHKRLFEIAEAAYKLGKEEFLVDKYDQIRAILQELKEYTLTHFEHEEAYMESINYKRMFSQKTQHEAFRQRLEDFDIQGIGEDEEDAIQQILTMLTDWLISHILYTDKLIAQP